MPGKPLDGVNILDFCWVVVGPMTTKYLGEFGATVVRVESAKRPEVLRKAAPFKDGIEGLNRSGYFANYNANKLGIAIDMRHPQARDFILRVLPWADLVTENFTPGTMESWGLGFPELQKANPRVILFSTSMLGRGGPLEAQPGFGAVLSSLAGLTNITGWPDRRPSQPLWGLHRLHSPSLRSCVNSSRLGLSQSHRGRAAPGHVSTGDCPPFLGTVAVGLCGKR